MKNKKISFLTITFALFLFPRNGSARCVSGEERYSFDADGKQHSFICDTKFSKLGEAWRDPDALIWSDVLMRFGVAKKVSYSQAHAYCKSIGARLPSREEFLRLRRYMGASAINAVGYTPQVLPNLEYQSGDKKHQYTFWSNLIRFQDRYAYIFLSGSLTYDIVTNQHKVRCVAKD